jgi:hypothetical protein
MLEGCVAEMAAFWGSQFIFGGAGSNATSSGGTFLNNHNWVEFWDDSARNWSFVNVPPVTLEPNTGLCDFSWSSGCNYDPQSGCTFASGPGAAMRDHEIVASTWSFPGDEDRFSGGPIVAGDEWVLSSGEKVTPLVWASNFTTATGMPLSAILRFVNRTDHYRCREPPE